MDNRVYIIEMTSFTVPGIGNNKSRTGVVTEETWSNLSSGLVKPKEWTGPVVTGKCQNEDPVRSRGWTSLFFVSKRVDVS